MADYSLEQQIKLTKKLRLVLDELPAFCTMYFTGIDSTTAIRTRLAYATDLKTFFQFLLDEVSLFTAYSSLGDFTLNDIERLDSWVFEQFLSFLSAYQKDDQQVLSNANPAKARKLSSIRSMYRYFHKKGLISSNPSLLVDMPVKKDKPIVRLEANESADLLDNIENGIKLTKTQQRYHDKTKERDAAIITLLLGTGIRISECVGLNIEDIDFTQNSFKVTRKGGNKEILYFNDEVKEALEDYLTVRKKIIPLPGAENALFLSLQKKRMQVSAIQKMLKKYTAVTVPLKTISPHKLRSTFGTNLYRETGDIYLVADVLGHKDVNTTKKHYAATSEEMRKNAAKQVKLR